MIAAISNWPWAFVLLVVVSMAAVVLVGRLERGDDQ